MMVKFRKEQLEVSDVKSFLVLVFQCDFLLEGMMLGIGV